MNTFQPQRSCTKVTETFSHGCNSVTQAGTPHASHSVLEESWGPVCCPFTRKEWKQHSSPNQKDPLRKLSKEPEADNINTPYCVPEHHSMAPYATNFSRASALQCHKVGKGTLQRQSDTEIKFLKLYMRSYELKNRLKSGSWCWLDSLRSASSANSASGSSGNSQRVWVQLASMCAGSLEASLSKSDSLLAQQSGAGPIAKLVGLTTRCTVFLRNVLCYISNAQSAKLYPAFTEYFFLQVNFIQVN